MKTKFEIDGSSIDDFARKLLTLADRMDDIGGAAGRLSRTSADAMKQMAVEQEKINEALRQEAVERVKQGQSIAQVREAVKQQQSELRKQATQLLKDTGALTDEQSDLAAALSVVVSEFDKLEDAAAILDDISDSTKAGNLLAEARAEILGRLGQRIVEVGKLEKEGLQGIVEIGEQLKGLDAQGDPALSRLQSLFRQLGDEMARTDERVIGLSKDLAQLSESGGKSGKTESGLKIAVEQVRKGREDIDRIIGEITKGIFEEGLPDAVKPLLEEVLKLRDGLVALQEEANELDVVAEAFANQLRAAEGNTEQTEKLADELREVTALQDENRKAVEKNVASQEKLAEQIADTYDKQQEAEEASIGRVQELQSGVEQSGKSIRTRMREAREEVLRLVEESGKITPEVIEAARSVAELKKEVSDVDALINALNPEQKFVAFAQGASAVVGGLTAVQGALALMNVDSEEAGKLLVKIQAALAISQGLNSFVQLGGALKNIRAVIIATTVAKEADTAVTGANTAATAANAAAQTGAAAATGGLTAAVRGLTLAMAANPITAAVVVLAGIATALIALSEDAKDVTRDMQKFNDELEKMQEAAEYFRDREASLAGIRAEEKAIRAGNDAEAQRLALLAEQQVAIDELTTKQQTYGDLWANSQARLNKLTDEFYDGLDDEGRIKLDFPNDEAKQEFERLQKLVDEYYNTWKKTGDDLIILNGKNANQILAFDRDLAEKRAAELEKAEKERLAKLKEARELQLQLEENFAASFEALKRRTEAGELTGKQAELERLASAAAQNGQIEQEREFRKQIIDLRLQQANDEIDILQRALERKAALIVLEKQLGVDAYKELTDAQKEQAADGLIASGKVALSEAQLAEITKLRIQARIQSEKELTEVLLSEFTKRVDAEKKAQQDTLQYIDLREQYAQAQLSAAEAQGASFVDILQQNGVQETDAVRSYEEAKLLITKQYALERLKVLEASGELTDAIEAENLRGLIANLEQSITELRSAEVDWAKLLGLTPEEFERVKDKLTLLMSQALQATGSFLSQTLFDDRIREIDAYLDKLNEAIGETEAALEREARFREEGVANDYEREKDKLERLQQLKEDAQKEAERIARRQQLIDAAGVVSGTVLSVINVLKDATLKGGVLGIALAAAALPGIFALINAAKSKARDVGKFFEGTPWLELNGNRKGRDTIPIMAHEGERIVPTADNLRDWDLLEGLRLGDKKLLAKGFADAAGRHGVSLGDLLEEFGGRSRVPRMDDKVVRRMYSDRREIERGERREAFMDAIEGGVLAIERNTGELVSIMRDKPDRHYLPDGTMIEHRGSTKRVTKPKTT